MYRRLVQSVMVTVLLAGCGALPYPSSAALPSWISERPPQRLASTVYALGPQDLLDITVYEYPELTLQVRIAPNGTFMYPRIGIVQAAGLTVTQLEQEMTRSLKAHQLSTPHVAITVREYRNQHVYILGEVRLPGVYSLQQNATLEGLLTLAHGVTPDAGGYVLVVRGYHNTKPLFRAKVRHLESLPGMRVNLNELLSGNLVLSIHIHSGDMIYVPRQQIYFANSYNYESEKNN